MVAPRTSRPQAERLVPVLSLAAFGRKAETLEHSKVNDIVIRFDCFPAAEGGQKKTLISIRLFAAGEQCFRPSVIAKRCGAITEGTETSIERRVLNSPNHIFPF